MKKNIFEKKSEFKCDRILNNLKVNENSGLFRKKMCTCAMNRTLNQDLHVLQVCCYSQVLI